MDPGTAVGVASLGIQVCQGLVEYYRDWKDYNDDILEICTEITELNKTFALLDQNLRALPSSIFVDRTTECTVRCQHGIDQLDKQLKTIRKENPAGLKQKAQAGVLRLLYPFRKSTLEKLRALVQVLMQQLSLALQVVQLDTSASTRATATQIQNTIDDVSSLTTQLQASALDTHTQVSSTAADVQLLVAHEDRKLLKDILEWLAAPDRSMEHRAARKKYEEGTGKWLLTSDSYRKWISGDSAILWLYGKAGCCKTVLCSTIIEDVQCHFSGRTEVRVAYFYFTFSDSSKQTYRSLLLSLVTELSRKHPIDSSLRALHDKTKPHTPSEEALEVVLTALLQEAKSSYIIIDALDECAEDEKEQVIEGLKSVTQACMGLRVLITSRREDDIYELMQSWCQTQLAIDEGCVNADIDIYVRNAIATDRKLMKLPLDTQNEIKKVFRQKSDGMFRWAALQLQAIRNLRILRPAYISTALYKMPQSLDETYERILSAIDDLYFTEARLALEWLVFSISPLSVAELAEACSISVSAATDPHLTEGGYEAIVGLLSVISSLVVVGDPDPPTDPNDYNIYGLPSGQPYPAKFDLACYSQRIRLAHFSVKEYLLSDRIQKSAPQISRYALLGDGSHYCLAELCCAYILYFTNQDDVQLWVKEERIPTQARGAEWGGYETQDYLEDWSPAYPLLSYAYESGQRNNKRQPGWHDGTHALYWAAFLGLHKSVTFLCNLEPLPDLDRVSGKYGTALQAAAHKGEVFLALRFMLLLGEVTKVSCPPCFKSVLVSFTSELATVDPPFKQPSAVATNRLSRNCWKPEQSRMILIENWCPDGHVTHDIPLASHHLCRYYRPLSELGM
ncbi:hypothetical protein N0V94_006230 [Neodidymelliopsis sp. IMI 364377]|nr:hypothetical protein N0V94_006230 [Neodidymelliopsis sp. IMI 364377]